MIKEEKSKKKNGPPISLEIMKATVTRFASWGAVLLVADMSCVGGGETDDDNKTTRAQRNAGRVGQREKFVADKGLGHSSFKKRRTQKRKEGATNCALQ